MIKSTYPQSSSSRIYWSIAAYFVLFASIVISMSVILGNMIYDYEKNHNRQNISLHMAKLTNQLQTELLLPYLHLVKVQKFNHFIDKHNNILRPDLYSSDLAYLLRSNVYYRRILLLNDHRQPIAEAYQDSVTGVKVETVFNNPALIHSEKKLTQSLPSSLDYGELFLSRLQSIGTSEVVFQLLLRRHSHADFDNQHHIAYILIEVSASLFFEDQPAVGLEGVKFMLSDLQSGKTYLINGTLQELDDFSLNTQYPAAYKQIYTSSSGEIATQENNLFWQHLASASSDNLDMPLIFLVDQDPAFFEQSSKYIYTRIATGVIFILLISGYLSYLLARRQQQLKSLQEESIKLGSILYQENIRNNSLTIELDRTRVLSSLITAEFPETVIQINLDGIITHAAHDLEDFSGYLPYEVILKSVNMLIPGLSKQLPEEFPEKIDNVLPLWIDSSNLSLIHQDGHNIPVSINLVPILEMGKPNWIVSINDISEKVLFETEILSRNAELEELDDKRIWILNNAQRIFEERTHLIRESQQHFKKLVENISDVFWLISPDWQKVLYVSPSYEKIWGQGVESLYHNPLDWLNHLHPDDRSKVEIQIQQYLNTKMDVYDFPEYRVIRPDDSICWIKAKGYPLTDKQGRVYQIVGVAIDITLYKTTQQQLLDSEQKRAEMDRNAIEEERRRLGQELHDEIGQLLTALNINLEMLRRKIPQHSEATTKPLNIASQITRELLQSVRYIVHNLRPPQLEDLGLTAALRWHLKNMQQSSEIEYIFNENLGNVRLPLKIELNCFRIIQEAITNTLRHADASLIDINIIYTIDAINLEISDDGVGFNAEEIIDKSLTGSHYGLRSIRERTYSMQGEFSIETAPGKGCSISILIRLLGETNAI